MSGGETSLSGYDNASQALSYTPGQEQVYLNGILLVRGDDYTATNGTSITGLSALSASDFIQVNCYNNFSVASVPSSSITGDITNSQILSLEASKLTGTVANNQLANSSISINGSSVSLGGSVSGLATLSSPTFTGTPAAPTASAGTNTTQIATTAFVRTEVTNLIASAPAALDTLDELALALGDDANFATTVTNSLAAKAPLASPTFTGTVAITGTTKIQQILEKATVSATAATGTINYDVLTNGAVTYYTSNASGNWTLNIRGDGSNTLNSVMSTGESLTIAFLVTNGGTAYYQSALQIDGNAVTPKYQDGTSISSGNTSSIDVYSITVVKTGSAAFTAFLTRTKFA
ncbi:MAG: hypothetical protein FJ356_06345 [Thaumarchaeota archaeon]|nr:hypothetical protein [Nitrososphaerota archaeon]